MPDGPGRLRRLVALLLPTGTIFLAWAVLDEIADRGRALSPSVIGSARFQIVAAIVLALILAAGWLVGLRGVLRARGRARIVNAAAATLFALLCLGSAVSHIYVSQTLWEGVAQIRETFRPQPR